MVEQQLKNKIQGVYGIIVALYFFVAMIGKSFMPLSWWWLAIAVLGVAMTTMAVFLYKMRPWEQKNMTGFFSGDDSDVAYWLVVF